MLKTSNALTPQGKAQTNPARTKKTLVVGAIAPPPQFEFVSKYEISQLTGLAPATLKRYRLSGRLSENIH
jgi:hypothetical protein